MIFIEIHSFSPVKSDTGTGIMATIALETVFPFLIHFFTIDAITPYPLRPHIIQPYPIGFKG
jgi:hypothetical protein